MPAVYRTHFSVATTRSFEAIDITPKIIEALENSGVHDGLLTMQSLHTTTALLLNEAESGLLQDIEGLASILLRDREWRHDKIDNNAIAHLMSAMTGSALTLAWENSRPLLGTWQSIIFLEMDGPRRRTVHLSLLPC